MLRCQQAQGEAQYSLNGEVCYAAGRTGLGYSCTELAKLGDYSITGLDISGAYSRSDFEKLVRDSPLSGRDIRTVGVNLCMSLVK